MDPNPPNTPDQSSQSLGSTDAPSPEVTPPTPEPPTSPPINLDNSTVSPPLDSSPPATLGGDISSTPPAPTPDPEPISQPDVTPSTDMSSPEVTPPTPEPPTSPPQDIPPSPGQDSGSMGAPVVVSTPTSDLPPSMAGSGSTPSGGTVTPSLNQATPDSGGSKKPGGSKKLKKLIILIVIAVVVLGGGGAFAFVALVLPNEPNNAVGLGILNLLNSKNGIGSYSITDNIKGSSSTSPGYQISITGGSDQNENTVANIEIDYSVLKITLSAIVRPSSHELYLKSDEISTLIGYLSSLSGVSSSPQLAALAAKLNNNWIQIDVAGLQSVGLLTSQEAAKANTCIDALSQAVTGPKSTLVNNLKSAYESNRFYNATKVGTSTINGASAKKFQLTINSAKVGQFDKAFSASEASLSKGLSAACGSSSASSVTGDVAANSSSPSTIYVWVNSSRKLVQFEDVQKVDGANNDFTVNFNNQSFDASAPTQVVTLSNLKSVLQELLPELSQTSPATTADQTTATVL